MTSRIIDKLTVLQPWQLLVVGIVSSEILTLLFSGVFSIVLWGTVSSQVLIIGMIDAFLVALILVFLTTIIVKRIRITEITNKQLLAEIEDRKQIEAHNKELEQQLRQSQKMEAVGTLAGGIAHDFNNILTAILGYSEMAKLQLQPNDKASHDIDQVIQAGQRAADLVQQILTFSRQGEEKCQPLRIQHIIKEALKLLRASLPTTLQLEEQIDSNCPPVLADPTQIHQVLMNLCTNAKDAIGEKIGILHVALSQVSITETVKDHLHLDPGQYLDLEIADDGSGIDSMNLTKIFDPFFTTKGKGKGTGLGLAVIHGIIKQHNGEITVTSEPGYGTTFHVYLPVIRDEVCLVEQNRDVGILRGNGERILFVDDEPSITEMMKERLESLGYSLTIFTSSVEALREIRDNPENFDLLITDMTMPEMTGIDLTREVLAIKPEMPIILCSGFSEIINNANAKSFGVSEYLNKPVDHQTMAQAIRTALSGNNGQIVTSREPHQPILKFI